MTISSRTSGSSSGLDTALKTSDTTSDKRMAAPSFSGAPNASDLSNSVSAKAPLSGKTPAKKGAKESDELLVDRVRAGDREAFDEIYQRYFKRVYAFLDKRLNNRADTEEVTQEVFINIFSSLDSFRGEAPFAAWIFGLTRRTLAARFRRKRHPTVPLFEEDDDVSYTSLTAGGTGEATPLEHYEMAERAEQITHVIENEMSADQRQLFEMHHLESRPIAEIAETLSKSEDSVKSGLYRTRKLLFK